MEQTHTPSEATVLQEAFHWDHLGKSLSGAQLNGEGTYDVIVFAAFWHLEHALNNEYTTELQ